MADKNKMEINAVMYFDYVARCFEEISETAARLSVNHKRLKDLSENPLNYHAIIAVPELKEYFDTKEGAAKDTVFIKDKLIEVFEFISTVRPHYENAEDK